MNTKQKIYRLLTSFTSKLVTKCSNLKAKLKYKAKYSCTWFKCITHNFLECGKITCSRSALLHYAATELVTTKHIRGQHPQYLITHIPQTNIYRIEVGNFNQTHVISDLILQQ